MASCLVMKMDQLLEANLEPASVHHLVVASDQDWEHLTDSMLVHQMASLMELYWEFPMDINLALH